jgi:short-subunit dehydrogenase
MRQQRSGHILNITSVGGIASMGGFALYCATKFAVEGFSEGLCDEVKPLGIRVTIVEPGAFRTNFAAAAYSFWEQKNIALQQDLAKWRSVGEDTAFEDAKVRPIGGKG